MCSVNGVNINQQIIFWFSKEREDHKRSFLLYVPCSVIYIKFFFFGDKTNSMFLVLHALLTSVNDVDDVCVFSYLPIQLYDNMFTIVLLDRIMYQLVYS